MVCARWAPISIQGDERIAFSLLQKILPEFLFKDKSENTFINMFVPRDNTKIVNVFHSLVGYYENTGAENTGAGGKRTGGRFQPARTFARAPSMSDDFSCVVAVLMRYRIFRRNMKCLVYYQILVIL